jgi:hypothetical protein
MAPRRQRGISNSTAELAWLWRQISAMDPGCGVIQGKPINKPAMETQEACSEHGGTGKGGGK